jgi:hypothetical protein
MSASKPVLSGDSQNIGLGWMRLFLRGEGRRGAAACGRAEGAEISRQISDRTTVYIVNWSSSHPGHTSRRKTACIPKLLALQVLQEVTPQGHAPHSCTALTLSMYKYVNTVAERPRHATDGVQAFVGTFSRPTQPLPLGSSTCDMFNG